MSLPDEGGFNGTSHRAAETTRIHPCLSRASTSQATRRHLLQVSWKAVQTVHGQTIHGWQMGLSPLTASQQPPANKQGMKDVRLKNKHVVSGWWKLCIFSVLKERQGMFASIRWLCVIHISRYFQENAEFSRDGKTLWVNNLLGDPHMLTSKSYPDVACIYGALNMCQALYRTFPTSFLISCFWHHSVMLKLGFYSESSVVQLGSIIY